MFRKEPLGLQATSATKGESYFCRASPRSSAAPPARARNYLSAPSVAASCWHVSCMRRAVMRCAICCTAHQDSHTVAPWERSVWRPVPHLEHTLLMLAERKVPMGLRSSNGWMQDVGPLSQIAGCRLKVAGRHALAWLLLESCPGILAGQPASPPGARLPLTRRCNMLAQCSCLQLSARLDT